MNRSEIGNVKARTRATKVTEGKEGDEGIKGTIPEKMSHYTKYISSCSTEAVYIDKEEKNGGAE